jgi:putative oxidoreductase
MEGALRMDEFNAALLMLRLLVGLGLAAHGYNKVFGGGGVSGTAGWFDSIGMRPGRLNAYLAAGTELVAGVALAAGLLTTLSAMAYVGVMTVAAITTHVKHGFFIIKEGYEYVLVLAVCCVVIAMLGPGEWSIDSALDIDDTFDGWLGLALAGGGGVAAGLAQLAVFYRPPKGE